eukprot:TRINITY_DN14678_c0_g1_i1.p1 TRINITY_DN14678_c0_g1~~TRINITY_DN14678_c0_g1_i1.p1  ORF type:complete len:246 (+),score=54.35 TRINITY_DN14678_c0_g1_i1:463-1200(+)
MVIDRLKQHIPYAPMLREDTARALHDPSLMAGLKMMGEMTGRPVDLARLREQVVALENQPEAMQTARGGKTISPFDRVLGDLACEGLAHLGNQAEIGFNFDVQFAWHPLEAQRLLLWAAERGRAELFAEALAVLHFEKASGSCLRDTVVAAAEQAGLDRVEVLQFLESDQKEAEVWASYADMVSKHRIHSIPLFVFNGPCTSGGPFREKEEHRSGDPRVVNGSASTSEFLAIFEAIFRESRAASL